MASLASSSNYSSVPTSFDRYDEEFTSLIEQIQTSLNEIEDGSSTAISQKYTNNLLQQCDDLIKQMALEARSGDPDQKRQMLQKVKACKTQYQELVQQSDRQGLLAGTPGGGGSTGSSANKERLLLQKNEDMMATQNDRLERARRTMQETEQVALEITEELGNNRETLTSAHGRIREVSGLTGRAKRVLNRMSQRALQQKMILYTVAIGLVVVFFLLLWFMWRR